MPVLEIASACVVSAGAAVTFWMATFTRRTTVEKIRLDLYDRRFAIYETTLAHKLLLENSTKESVKTEEFIEARRAFIKSMRESQFLFRPDSGVFERLTQLGKASFDIVVAKENQGTNFGSPELAYKLLNDSIAAFFFFDRSIVFLEQAMAPYLNFQEALLVEDEQVRVLKKRFWEWFLSDFAVAPAPSTPPALNPVDAHRP